MSEIQDGDEDNKEAKKPDIKDFYSRHSGVLTRTINQQISKIHDFINKKLEESNLEAETTGLLLSAVVIIKKSVQIEGWHGFVISVNKHTRIMLGEKFKGPVPEHWFEKIKLGKVYPRLNRSTLLANVIVIMPFACQTLINKLSREML